MGPGLVLAGPRAEHRERAGEGDEEQRTTWSVLNRKPFQAPLAIARASARTATARTWRGAATVASASGAST